jgi:putative heme transporter
MSSGTLSTFGAAHTASVSPAWRAWARRLAVPAGLLAAAAAVAIALGGPAQTFLRALERAFEADPRWVVAGLVFELCSFAGYIFLLWHVAGRDAPRLRLRESYQITMAGLAATRLLPTAGMGGAALTLWALQRSGHRGRAGVRTLLTFLVVVYSVFLGAILVVGGLAATGVLASGGPVVLSAVPAGLAGLGILVALWLSRRSAAPRPARSGRLARVDAGATVLGEAVRSAQGVVRRGDPRLLGALAWWGFDVAVLWAAFQAAGTPPPLAVIVLGYFVGQVANTVPVPGAASSGMVGVLLAFGVDPALTLASVLAYRAMAIWIPAPFGAHAAAGLKRTVSRWAAQDGDAEAEAEEAVAPFAPVADGVAPRSGRLSVRPPAGCCADTPLAA